MLNIIIIIFLRLKVGFVYTNLRKKKLHTANIESLLSRITYMRSVECLLKYLIMSINVINDEEESSSSLVETREFVAAAAVLRSANKLIQILDCTYNYIAGLSLSLSLSARPLINFDAFGSPS